MNIYQVDAFTQRIFGGNPAAVCLLEEPAKEEWMQNLAMEMNLSETAFAWPEEDGYRLRWFTPKVEVDLCGHATLATSHILWQLQKLSHDDTARFFTRSGLLTCTKNSDWIEMDFPAKQAIEVTAPEGLTEALGVNPIFVGNNKMDYLIEIESEEVLRNLQPNFSELSKLPIRGTIVTASSQSTDYDFISRFFAPAVGVNEDPVTGSAHTALGPYWAAKLSKTTMTGFQASARGGVVKVRLVNDRVLLGGQAITVMKGELY
ncbi:PhzF family phenazine biosynthesis protein [Cytophagaceae bacterium DM2B3-1]|uniref:PhzF family phenazine biosynthesis protein n=1 Tax=Xanthocytophaga flava TaxID=3048013 RepID=A0ABT7CCK2_9BACT|nr:PhzF family phenazine biosynthesis protein [Xanthocytophaga flavus]MDJ1470050.1 PhzF family phenazine biosynthesis protein [Xanthocytophaga flavus]MDJ1491386.1 PhzF family phenazine biosynthesis protein [Xanthocytophaga flavus]